MRTALLDAGAGPFIAASRTVLVALLLSATTFTSVGAQSLSYGPTGGGGSGTWDNVTVDWFNGSAAVPWASGGTAVFGGATGTVTVNGTVSVGGATFDTDGYTVTGGTLALSGATPTITTNAGVSATISSAVSGSTGLVKSGTGTLTFSGAKTYTGATIVDAGRLVLSNVTGFVSPTTVNSGATLTFTGTGNVSTTAPITLNDGATLENINPSGYAHLIGAVTSTGNTSINADAPAGPNRRFYLDGGLMGSGTVTINAGIAGNAVVLRNNNSTFSGTVIVNGIANTNSGLGSGLALGGGGNALINANVELNGTIELADQGIGSGFGTSVFNMGALSGSGIITANRNPIGNFGATIVLGHTDDSGHFSGSINRGSGITNVVGVTKVGTGTQIFSGASNYQGFTNVNEGVLNIRNNTALGSTVRGTNVASGAALQIEGDIAVGAEALTLNGTGVANDGALRNMSGVNSYGGPITLGSAVRINSDAGMLTLGAITGAAQNLTLGGAGGTTITGDIGITSGTLTKDGSGTAILSGTNTYTGATFIQGGTLQAGAAAGGRAFGTLSAVTLADVAGATLNLNSFDQTIGSLDGGGTTGGNVMLGSATLTTGGNGTSTTFGGAIDGTGALVKLGAGTQILAGTSTYSGGTTISGGTLRLGNGGTTGSIVGDVVNNGALEFFRSNTMTFAGEISGSGRIRQIGSGLTNLTGDSSAFTGTTFVQAGTLSVNGSLCGEVNVESGGRLQGSGTVCDTNNFAGGTIAPGNSIGTLTVAGNYIGDGGLLEIESVLGGDASPTDRLVVTGDTSGDTQVRVINLGGTGATTVEGIKIVDVGGVSNGAFTLQGDYVFLGQSAVIAGAYAYVLQKNGVSTPTDGDWYLRSTLTTPSPTPPGAPPPPPSGPIFAPTVPVYESYARVMLSLNELPTMQQRIGHRFRSGPDAMASMGVAGASATTFSPLWARIEGGHKNLNPVATARSTLDIDHYRFEGGADLVNVETGAGRWLVGVVGNYLEGNADVYSLFGDGRIRVTGGGIGGTVTWLGDAGFYFDGQGRASWYSGDLRSLAVGPIISGNDGFGYAFGAEVGHRLGIGGGWSITPQVQVNYSNVEYDDFTDRFGALVTLRNGESLLGRGGFSINHQHSWRDAAGRLVRSDVYSIANAYYEFMNGNTTLVSDTAFASAIDRLWGSIGAGGTFSWADDKYALYGEVSYRSSLNQPGDSYSYRGTAGFRVRW